MKEAPAENKIEQSIELGHNNYLYIFFLLFFHKSQFFFRNMHNTKFSAQIESRCLSSKKLNPYPHFLLLSMQGIGQWTRWVTNCILY